MSADPAYLPSAHASAHRLTPGLRGLERACAIVCPADAVADIALATARMQRFLRKDFYFVSVQLFFARGERSQRAGDALRLAALEAGRLEEAVRGLRGGAFAPAGERYRVRLLSPRCAALLRVVRRIDAAGAALLGIEAGGGIERRERLELLRPATRALTQIKLALLERPDLDNRAQSVS